MKMPRALSLVVFAAGCSPNPMPPNPDGGTMDAGMMDGGSDGACTTATLNTMGCDAGAGLGEGYCTLVTVADGGMEPYCEGAV
jgi:hypothetical protein